MKIINLILSFANIDIKLKPGLDQASFSAIKYKPIRYQGRSFV